MNKLHVLSSGILFVMTSSVFASTTEPKYETHYSIEKSSQVEHLKIAQSDAEEYVPNHA